MLKVFYNFLINFFYIPYCLLIYLRKFIGKEHKTKYKEKIFKTNLKKSKEPMLWFHAASIGEFNSILPLVDHLLNKNEKYNFLISTVTITSFHEFKKKYGENKRISHQFLPFDNKYLVKDFLEKWKPNVASFVDSEIWPNFFLEIKNSNIPLILINARITKKTFNRWKVVKNFANEIFGCITLSISSNRETVDFLKFFNVKNISYFGNIKFCSNINIQKDDFPKLDLKQNTWCAVSTHAGEEMICAKVHSFIKKSNQKVKTIIIPRHINRVKKIFIELSKMGFKIQIKNQNDSIKNEAEIILVNYYGSVIKYLKESKNVFIGKSLLKKLKNDSGQNPIDAAKLGCNIFHGPYVSNFQEIYDYLDNQKISEKIYDEKTLAEKIAQKINLDTKNRLKGQEILSSYSDQIFKNVIREYEQFIK